MPRYRAFLRARSAAGGILIAEQNVRHPERRPPTRGNDWREETDDGGAHRSSKVRWPGVAGDDHGCAREHGSEIWQGRVAAEIDGLPAGDSRGEVEL
jgi:hypothetical protein